MTAAFWSVLHPPSYHLLRCIAAALPVWAGYAETARACATNSIPQGAKVKCTSVAKNMNHAGVNWLSLMRMEVLQEDCPTSLAYGVAGCQVSFNIIKH